MDVLIGRMWKHFALSFQLFSRSNTCSKYTCELPIPELVVIVSLTVIVVSNTRFLSWIENRTQLACLSMQHTYAELNLCLPKKP